MNVPYKCGDKVSFLNEKGTGVVKSVLNNFHLVVTNEDGFDITVSINEIVPFKDETAYIIEPKRINEKEEQKIQAPKNKKEEIWEVDLHLHEIANAGRFTTDHAKLRYQVQYFRKCMDIAMTHRIRKIIFIHGVGKGTLKQEIIYVLKDYEGVKYYDAPLKKYGYGALVVEIC
jgi:dsDNA-specific endonuclease/ATPase MutS2